MLSFLTFPECRGDSFGPVPKPLETHTLAPPFLFPWFYRECKPKVTEVNQKGWKPSCWFLTWSLQTPPYILEELIHIFLLPLHYKDLFHLWLYKKEIGLGLWGPFKIQSTSDIMGWPESCFLLTDTWNNPMWNTGWLFLILLLANNLSAVLSSLRCLVNVEGPLSRHLLIV